MWAKLRSVRADPSSTRPSAERTAVPLRLSRRRAWQEEHTAVRAASSNARTLATLSDRRRARRPMPGGAAGTGVVGVGAGVSVGVGFVLLVLVRVLSVGVGFVLLVSVRVRVWV